MNVFVTGGAGYIGSICAEELLNAGHQVTVYDNLTEGHRSAVDARAKFVLGKPEQEDDVLNAVKGRHPNIGACADLGHYIRSAEDPVRVIHLLKGRLFGVHLKDFSEQKKDTKGVILGQGHLNVAGVFKALREVDYPKDACLALEYEEKPENPLEDVKQCLAVAAEGAKKSLS